MPQNYSAATNGAVRSNAGTACYAYATCQRRMRANSHVVTNLDQVVEFDAVLNDSVLQCTAVDACIGTDLHIIADTHIAQLLDFFPTSFMRRKTETISANHHTRMNNAARAYRAIVAKCDPHSQAAMHSHRTALAYHAVLSNTCAIRNDGLRPNACKRSNGHIFADTRRSINQRSGMNACNAGWPVVLLPDLRDPRKIIIRIVNNDVSPSPGCCQLSRNSNYNARCFGFSQFRGVFWMA